MHPKKLDSYSETSQFSSCTEGRFTFLKFLLKNSHLLECSSILVSSLNMILFQASVSHSSYIFDQLNLAFKWFLFNAGFLAAMDSVHVLKGCA